MHGFHGNTLSNQPLGRKLSMGNGHNIPQLVKSGQFCLHDVTNTYKTTMFYG